VAALKAYRIYVEAKARDKACLITTRTKADQPALQSSEVAVDRQEPMVLQRYNAAVHCMR